MSRQEIAETTFVLASDVVPTAFGPKQDDGEGRSETIKEPDPVIPLHPSSFLLSHRHRLDHADPVVSVKFATREFRDHVKNLIRKSADI